MNRLCCWGCLVAGLLTVARGAAGVEHCAELPAVADTAILTGEAWATALDAPLGAAHRLPLSTQPGQSAEALFRFSFRTLGRSPYLRVTRARLVVNIAAQASMEGPRRIEVSRLSGGAPWEEESLTSRAWAETLPTANWTEEPAGAVSFAPQSAPNQWQSVSLKPGVIVAAAMAGERSLTLKARNAFEGTANGLFLNSRETGGGAFAPRLLVWYEGDYLPELDPEYAPWGPPETRALFASLTPAGDAPVVAARVTTQGPVLRLDWIDDPRTELPAGLIAAPIEPVALDGQLRIAFELVAGAVRGEATFSVIVPAESGARHIWRQTLTTGTLESRCDLGWKDFEHTAGPPPAPWGPRPSVSPPMSQPELLFAFDSPSTGAAAFAFLSGLRITSADPASTPSASGVRPTTTRAFGYEALLRRIPPRDEALRLADPRPERPTTGFARRAMALGPMTAGEVALESAWSTFYDGFTLNHKRWFFTDAERGAMASLLLPGTARAVAARVAAAARRAPTDFTLLDPAWPWRADRDEMGGYGPDELARFRAFLKQSPPDFDIAAPAGTEPLGFWDYFEKAAGFRPAPDWFGYENWDDFSPVFQRSDKDGAGLLRRRRLLTQLAARYAWLRFVNDAARQAKRPAPARTRFRVCVDPGDPRAHADAATALALRDLDGVWLRRTPRGPDDAFEDVYCAWPALSRRARVLNKNLGLSIDVFDGRRIALHGIRAYAAAYAWRASGAGDLRIEGLEGDVSPGVRQSVEHSLALGAADAASDNARGLADRDALLLTDDAGLDSPDAFDLSRPFPNLAPLLRHLHVEFDAATVSSVPAWLDRYRIIILNATTSPSGLCERLARWLNAREDRRLITLGAVPARTRRADLFWTRADHETNPTTPVALDEGAPLGLKALRIEETRLSPIFVIGEAAPQFPARIKPRSLITPASHRLYDYAGERAVLLSLDDGFPLVSETRPTRRGGRVIYLHYNAGLPAPAQTRFDRLVLASVADHVNLRRAARGGEGLSIQAFQAPGGKDGKGAFSVFILRPQPEPWEIAGSGQAAAPPPSAPGVDVWVSLPAPATADEAVIYWLADGRREVRRVDSGSVDLRFVGAAPEVLYIGPSSDMKRMDAMVSARRGALRLGPPPAPTSQTPPGAAQGAGS